MENTGCTGEEIITCWLWQTYKKCPGESVKLSEIQKEFSLSPLKDISLDSQLQEREMGRILQRVFPFTKRERKSFPIDSGMTVRHRVYSDLSTISEPFSMEWDDIATSYVPPKPSNSVMAWSVNQRNENDVHWIIINGEDLCDGKRMVRELRVCRNLSINFFIMSNEVPLNIDRVQAVTRQFLDNLFEFCAEVPLCKGFEVNVNKSVKDKQGNVIGVTEQWEICDEQETTKSKSMRHRAVNCSLIRCAHEIKCRNCESIRSHCHRKLNNSEANGEHEMAIKKRKRISYMTPEEITQRLRDEQTRAKNAEKKADRAGKAKEEILKQMEEFTNEDSSNFKTMFEKIDENDLSDGMKLFWEAQKNALENKDSRGNRWHPKVIRLCLSVWNRSPEAYKQLKESGMMKLPSGRLLSLYKNSVCQKPGLHEEVFDWLVKEIKKSGLDDYGKEGGLILDEMSIQEDLQFKTVDGVKTLVGLVDLGEEHDFMTALEKGERKAELASHVCQFVFLGNTGFRFPFAHWPTKEISSCMLYDKFWEAVCELLMRGIRIVYCCCDGGQANRDFINIHFKDKDPVKDNFTVKNPYTRKPMIFILDFSVSVMFSLKTTYSACI